MWGLYAQIKELKAEIARLREKNMTIYAIFESGFNHEYFISAWSTREKAEAEMTRMGVSNLRGFFISEVEVDKS